MARFDAETGLLQSYRSTHFPKRRDLKNAVHALVRDAAPLVLMVLEGDTDLAALWQKQAAKLDPAPRVHVVSAHDWRPDMLLDRQQRSGKDAKRHADTLAREIIARSPAANPTSLKHDAAEAICLGAWAVEHLLS